MTSQTFIDFAAQFGLIINEIIYGRWVRVPTTDHKHKRNGAYRHLGEVAFVQNHATQLETVTWFAAKDNKIDPAIAREALKKAQREITQGHIDAAKKAEWIMSQCVLEKHAYLDAHGMPDIPVQVYHRTEHENLLCIPMKIGNKLVGVQMITRDGDKKFLFGQQCKGAEWTAGKGINCWVEGWATALAAQICAHQMDIKINVHACFSASNMIYMAKGKTCFVLADNDVSGAGLRAAEAIGLPYLISDIVGDDFCDTYKKNGVYGAGGILKQWFVANRKNIR